MGDVNMNKRENSCFETKDSLTLAEYLSEQHNWVGPQSIEADSELCRPRLPRRSKPLPRKSAPG